MKVSYKLKKEKIEGAVVFFSDDQKVKYRYDRKTRVLYRLWQPLNSSIFSWQEVLNGHTIALILTELSQIVKLRYYGVQQNPSQKEES